jgi:hypothetical protein
LILETSHAQTKWQRNTTAFLVVFLDYLCLVVV